MPRAQHQLGEADHDGEQTYSGEGNKKERGEHAGDVELKSSVLHKAARACTVDRAQSRTFGGSTKTRYLSTSSCAGNRAAVRPPFVFVIFGTAGGEQRRF
jgi:hypothetical protein